jgi:hypothetical protein
MPILMNSLNSEYKEKNQPEEDHMKRREAQESHQERDRESEIFSQVPHRSEAPKRIMKINEMLYCRKTTKN